MSTTTTDPNDATIALHGWTAVPVDANAILQGRPYIHEPGPLLVKDIGFPSDDPVVAKVHDYAREHLPPQTFNHSMRVFYFGMSPTPPFPPPPRYPPPPIYYRPGIGRPSTNTHTHILGRANARSTKTKQQHQQSKPTSSPTIRYPPPPSPSPPSCTTSARPRPTSAPPTCPLSFTAASSRSIS